MAPHWRVDNPAAEWQVLRWWHRSPGDRAPSVVTPMPWILLTGGALTSW